MKLTLLMVQSVDGVVAKNHDEFINWSSREDKKLFVAETKRAGVIIMGRRTFDTIGKPLSGRTIIVMTRTVRAPITEADGTVEFTTETPQMLVARLDVAGHAEAMLAGGPSTNAAFLEANLIDEIKLTVEPKIFGSGLSMFDGASFDKNLELIETRALTPHVFLLHYRVVK